MRTLIAELGRRVLRGARAHRDRALPAGDADPGACGVGRGARVPSRAPARGRGGGGEPRRRLDAGAARGPVRLTRATTWSPSRSRARRAPARRSVRAGMKVTRLPDVAPGTARARRHRHLRRRPPRPPGGDPRRRHGAHVRPAPACGHPPRGHAEAGHPVRRQARPDRRARGGGAGGDPVRPRASPSRSARRVRGGRPDRPARRGRGLGRGELPLRPRARGRPGAARARTRVRDARGAARGGGRGDGVVEPHPRAGRRRRGEPGGRVPGRAVPVRGRGRDGDRRGRELGMPTANLVPDDAFVCPGHGVYAAWAHGLPRGGERGRAAHLRDRARAARGGHLIGFEGDLYGETAADRVPRAHARREALRVGGRAGRADAARRRRGPGDRRTGCSCVLLPFRAR